MEELKHPSQMLVHISMTASHSCCTSMRRISCSSTSQRSTWAWFCCCCWPCPSLHHLLMGPPAAPSLRAQIISHWFLWDELEQEILIMDVQPTDNVWITLLLSDFLLNNQIRSFLCLCTNTIRACAHVHVCLCWCVFLMSTWDCYFKVKVKDAPTRSQ